MQNIIKHFFLMMGVLLPCAAMSTSDVWPPKHYAQVITVTGGIDWVHPGKTQTRYFTDTTTGTVHSSQYVVDKKTETLGQGELFLALQWPFNAYVNQQLGFAFGAAGEAYIDGPLNVNDSASGSQYRYRLIHGVTGIRGKLVGAKPFYTLQPYLTGLIGFGFNQSHGFFTSPTVDPTVSPPFFEDKTMMWILTYSIGAGIQKIINENWNIGIGYAFSDWGRSQLGDPTITTWDGSGPKLLHLYNNNLLFSLTYIC